MIVLVAASMPATALAASRAHALRSPRALLVAPICQTALDPPARAVSITAVMRPVTGTQKLAVEFQLLQRAAGAAAWTPVAGPGLGVWVSPTSPATLGQRPNDVWYVKKPVADLAAPAGYRFAVSFRWLGTGTTVLQSVTELSRVCREPELRPDLAVQSISTAPDPSHPKHEIYSAVIQNLGLTGAGPFTVELSVAGQPLVERTVQHIAPHQLLTVLLPGPACDPAQPPTVTVDPSGQVDVYSRTQATLAAQCSATTTTATRPRPRPRRHPPSRRRFRPPRTASRCRTESLEQRRYPSADHEDRNPSRVRRLARHVHVREPVHDPFDQVRDPRRDLFRVPSVLYGPSEARRHRWPGRALPAPSRQGAARRSHDDRRLTAFAFSMTGAAGRRRHPPT